MGTWLIVGLGNPGERYAGNRHNIGAMVVEHLAGEANTSLRVHKARARAAQLRLGQGSVIVAVPSSYMNESGGPVAGLMKFFKVPVDRLIVIHDDLDLDFGRIRLKRGGGEGGHNGLRSITTSVGTKDYLRVRAGIGRPPGRMDAARYVLRDFNAEQRRELGFVIPELADATRMLVEQGLEPTQNQVHSR